MAKAPREKTETQEVDPQRGDAILKRMLQAKPKPHKDMMAERKAGRSSMPEPRSVKKERTK